MMVAHRERSEWIRNDIKVIAARCGVPEQDALPEPLPEPEQDALDAYAAEKEAYRRKRKPTGFYI